MKGDPKSMCFAIENTKWLKRLIAVEGVKKPNFLPELVAKRSTPPLCRASTASVCVLLVTLPGHVYLQRLIQYIFYTAAKHRWNKV